MSDFNSDIIAEELRALRIQKRDYFTRAEDALLCRAILVLGSRAVAEDDNAEVLARFDALQTAPDNAG